MDRCIRRSSQRPRVRVFISQSRLTWLSFRDRHPCSVFASVRRKKRRDQRTGRGKIRDVRLIIAGQRNDVIGKACRSQRPAARNVSASHHEKLRSTRVRKKRDDPSYRENSNRRFATSETTARKVQGASDRRKEDSAEEKGEDVRARSARTTGRKVEGGRVTVGWQRKIER